MREALFELINILGFLLIVAILICTVIVAFQLIFNQESRKDLRYLINRIVKFFARIKINILQAMLYQINKALLKAERGTKHENVA